VTLLVVVSQKDPVAQAVTELWGALPATGLHVDGTPIRQLASDRLVLRRPGLHVEDERLDSLLLGKFQGRELTLVFPSIHRSRSGPRCFTVHPLGNPGREADAGGTPGLLVPADGPGMTGLLRLLDERSRPLTLPVTFEATHHGPTLTYPTFFAEIGGGGSSDCPSAEEAKVLAESILSFLPSEGDRTVIGAGGGHYVPHFTDLAIKRRWAFGHLLSDHALVGETSALLERAVAATPGCEGILFARTRDAERFGTGGTVRRLRENESPTRDPSPTAGT
jgi:D-tyrosyl-tRNA(Tyr) deacylase